MSVVARKSGPGKARFIWDQVKETAQYEIAALCIDYLSGPSVVKLLNETSEFADAESFETPEFVDRGNLCLYAIQAWPRHLLLGSSRPDLSLLQSQSNFPVLSKICSKGYWALLNCVTRSPTCGETLFPIFTGFGVPDVIRPLDETDIKRGLLEAASKDQARVVQLLLDKVEFNESILVDTLVAAAAHGAETMPLDHLISKGSDVKKLLDSGCQADPVAEWTQLIMASPLHHAARNAHTVWSEPCLTKKLT